VKITFEGQFFSDIVDQMRAMVAGLTPPKNISQSMSASAKTTALPPNREATEPQGPGPEDLFGGEPVDKPVDKTPELSEGQKQAAKMRAAKEAKAKERAEAEAADRAAKAKERAANVAARKAAASQSKPEEAKPVDPAEAIKVRQKTIEELQAAYANGMQKEVFELLSKFGNGAKSFRELPADAFGPIREAIDNGALTQ
jgi:hypothetical protein